MLPHKAVARDGNDARATSGGSTGSDGAESQFLTERPPEVKHVATEWHHLN